MLRVLIGGEIKTILTVIKETDKNIRVLIVGAGPTGLTAGVELARSRTVFE